MTGSVLTAVNPSSGKALDTYRETSVEEIAEIAEVARETFADARVADPDRRVAALHRAAAALRADATELCALCEAESGLPAGRVASELERTCAQLERFGEVISSGAHLEPIIDLPDPDATPAPRPDLRRMLVPLGPIVNFGASNFPFAFGVAGGDTAAALAAGCPVIAKGHPSQPGVNAAVGVRVAEAIAAAGLPAGTFAIVQGASVELSEALVDAEPVTAISFTGSLHAGRALYDRASRRPVPIPVFAEMGSVNPAVITEAALRARAKEIRDALITSVTFAAGQLCTKPGVALVPHGPVGDAFISSLVAEAEAAGPQTLLNERVHDSFARSLQAMASEPGVKLLTTPHAVTPGYHQSGALFEVDSATLQQEFVRTECFGPAVVLARYRGSGELMDACAAFEGQLAASIFAQPDEEPVLTAAVAERLAARVGRVVFDAFPTGVAVAWAMQHGGPYPATTASGHTSVGMTATRRFMRPVSWQSSPEAILPVALRNDNPLGIWRRVNGQMDNGPITKTD